MGLTIHWNWHGPKSSNEAKAIVEKMRQRALDLPFESVSEVVCNSRAMTPDLIWRSGTMNSVGSRFSPDSPFGIRRGRSAGIACRRRSSASKSLSPPAASRWR